MEITDMDSFIESVSGRCGDKVRCRRGNTCYERDYVKPYDPKTFLQINRRSMFSKAVHSWQGLTAGEKEKYAERAISLNMSGYNLYISEYMKTCISGETHNNAEESNAEITPLPAGFCSFSLVSASLQVRFSFASASILPLICLLKEAEGAKYCKSKGIIPP